MNKNKADSVKNTLENFKGHCKFDFETLYWKE